MLILNVALILYLYVIQKNYKCDNPNCPPIHAFTLTFQEIIQMEMEMVENKRV
jgi:hypothetical protein